MARTAGGLSLYERLVRDPQLRAELLEVVKKMEKDKDKNWTPTQLQPRVVKQKTTTDVAMKEVEV
jgi:hypothetical protein